MSDLVHIISPADEPNVHFAVNCRTPDGYMQSIFVAFYNVSLAPGAVAATDEYAETPIGTYTHGVLRHRIICFIVKQPENDRVPIFVRHMVTGFKGKNKIPVHEYYGFTRTNHASTRPFLKEIYTLNQRSGGEILNTYLFSKLYKYVRVSDDNSYLVGGEDPNPNTFTWVGIDYFGRASSLEGTRRLQEYTDGAFVFPNCVFTMTKEQTDSGSAILVYGNPIAITGQEDTTPLGLKPGSLRFISGYSSKMLEGFKKTGYMNTKKVEIRNSHFINGIEGQRVTGTQVVLDRKHEVGGVMIVRSTSPYLSLDQTSPMPASTEPTEFLGLYKFPGDICAAPLVKAGTPRTQPADLDYGLHTHPISCYVAFKCGFGPPSHGDLNVTLKNPFDGQIVYSYEGEWMIQIHPILKYCMKAGQVDPARVKNYEIPYAWEAKSRSRAIEMYNTGYYVPGNNPNTMIAVQDYFKVLGELRIVVSGIELPVFHGQYHRRVSLPEQNIYFAVPSQSFI